ncbi:AMP-binding protein [Luteolibacter flavescens]|uniref:AMP-binding protein n=1 Tax=Luteolibacter flavescens TaxID=1859460 RepID=A0ABT3FV40_9BACT|nr:AMP-binding protein [Luteolibacter flavescens]MCW1887463.1 AMP-binding protein [Luteolibacter flavescens]
MVSTLVPPASTVSTQKPHFFSSLESHGDRVAIVLPDGCHLSYRELAERADGYARQFSRRHQLLVIEMRNDIKAIAAYLGALRSGTPVILAAEGATSREHPIIATFRPEMAVLHRGSAWEIEARGEHADDDESALHPDLAVMLSTSGSTGSPKLVKLSQANLHENARSIAEYLEITPERRAITNLPLHYSYGLSVLNSHLAAGASVVLTELSVVDEEFWQVVRREQVTDLPGVPYTYELFEKVGLRSDPPESLRVMTQAGGRLPPNLVRDYSEFARSRGIRFFVMYGQTEATARMAYLPPEQTLENSDCIGVAIPRGKFEIRDEAGNAIRKPGHSGELVYQGPNVMMGYALKREDLAAPAKLTELQTGDIAQWSEAGFVKIVGRSSRFSKIAGLRIGLDDVERILRESGRRSYATGNDEFVAVALIDGSDAASARQLLAERCKLPSHHLIVFNLDEAPTLPSGKIDYLTIRKAGEELHRKEAADVVTGDDPVRALYGKALGQARIDDDASFATLGGDSLSYMIVSRGLEKMLGVLPQHWERLTFHDLEALRQERALNPVKQRATTTLSVDVLLRLLAISTIFIGHGAPDHTGWLRGGTTILFCLAGYSLCRFQREQFLAGSVVPAIKGAFRRIVIPYLLLMTALLFATKMPPHPAWWSLTSVFFIGTEDRGLLFSFWFIEALLHCLLIVSGLFLIPPLRRWARAQPFASGLALTGLGAAAFWVGRHFFGSESFSHKFDGWLYVYMLGWTFAVATRAWQRLLLVAVGSAVVIAQFGPESSRPYWFIGAMLVLAAVREIRLPAGVGGLVSQLAAASYMAYLAHPLVLHVTKFVLPERFPFFDGNVPAAILLAYVGTMLAGVVGAVAWQQVSRIFLMLFGGARRGSTATA